jgi:hypothetical protein
MAFKTCALAVVYSLEGYKFLLKEQKVWMGYINTFCYTAFGTCINIV